MSNETIVDNGPDEPQPPLPQPEDRRMQRTQITRYDLFVTFLGLIFLAAFFVVSWLNNEGKLAEGGYAAAIFLSLPPAIVLYHFLDTRARVVKGWMSLTGAGAVAGIIIFGYFYWLNSSEVPSLQRALSDEKSRIESLQEEMDRRINRLQEEMDRQSLITVMFPIEDTTGKLDQGLEEDFLFGIWLEGDKHTKNDEHWLIVDGVPRQKKYKAFAFHKKENNKKDLAVNIGRPDQTGQKQILRPTAELRFDKNPLRLR